MAKGDSTQNRHQNTDPSHQAGVKRTGGWGLEREKEKRRAIQAQEEEGKENK